MTPEALTEKGEDGEYKLNLYEWSGGKLQLVNIVPKATREEPDPGATFSTGDAYSNPWALSEDGRWIVFGDRNTWYVRDMVEHRTVQFGRPHGQARFQTMSRDGSRIFYIEPESNAAAAQEQEGELYMFDPVNGTTTDLTANHLEGEHSAGVQNMLVGISEDGSYAYFIAKGVLANGAVRGEDNLYMMHYDGNEWQTTFIATLSGEDEADWYSPGSINGNEINKITSRVTPNGQYLAFMSDRPLTGYDNRDVRSGEPDEEVYLYDAVTNRLVCASCDPSGARPSGVYEVPSTGGKLLMDQSGAWSGHWLAATIAPDWRTNGWYEATHRANYFSNSGRLFFNSSDALVPQDTNGVADVYEYEPPGVGSCTSSSATFSERSGGCVGLISSGQSAAESTFLEASESGDDVFFITAARLVAEDDGTANDVYDAHVCTEAEPCPAEPVSPPECTSGDSCKAAPSLQPELFGPTPSETFHGAGNVVVQPGSEGKPTLTRCAKGRALAHGTCVKKRAGKRTKRKRARRGATGKARRRGHR